MLYNIAERYSNKLAARDGHIGHVQDFYFDDTSAPQATSIQPAGDGSIEGDVITHCCTNRIERENQVSL